MSDMLTEQECDDLGVEPDALDAPELLTSSADSRALGFSSIPMAREFWTQLDQVRWLAVASARAEQVGIALWSNDLDPDCLMVSSVDGLRLDTSVSVAPELAYHRDDEDPATVYLRFEQGWSGCVRRPDGGGLVFKHVDKRLVAWSLSPTPEQCLAPLRTWLEESDDPWLEAFLIPATVATGIWHQAVAAGNFARLGRPPANRSAARIGRLMGGEGTSDDVPVWKWMRALPTLQLEALERRFQRELVRLLNELDEIESSIDPDSQEWSERLLRLLHHRDDLEAISYVFAVAGHPMLDSRQLTAFDHAGSLSIRTLPLPISVRDDGRLHVITETNPEVWWAWPAVVDW